MSTRRGKAEMDVAVQPLLSGEAGADSPAPDEFRSMRTASILQLALVAYFLVCGGPFGLELVCRRRLRCGPDRLTRLSRRVRVLRAARQGGRAGPGAALSGGRASCLGAAAGHDDRRAVNHVPFVGWLDCLVRQGLWTRWCVDEWL